MSLLLQLSAFVLIAGSALAQTGSLIEHLSRTVHYAGIAVCREGSRAAWTQWGPGQDSPQLRIAAFGSHAAPTRVHGHAEYRDSDPDWSPDCRTVAFLSEAAGNRQAQLWTASTDGGNARQRTHLNGYVARPRWSHDGTRIAFLYIEGEGGGGPLLAAPARTGVIDSEIRNQRIAVLDVQSGVLRQVSPAALHIYNFDWSPDDREFVATAAPGPGDNNWWIADLRRINAGTGEATSIYKPQYQIAVPRWSADGKQIAFIEGLMSDEGFHGGDLLTIAAEGGRPVNRTAGRRTSPSSLFWIANDRIVITETVGGGTAISELSIRDGAIRELWRGAEDLHAAGNFPNFALTPSGAISAAVRSSYERPPAVWTGPPGEWTKLTHDNDALKPEWGKTENLEWTNDGLRIQGWLIAPREVVPGRRSPLVVIVHGGPSSAEKPQWPSGFFTLAPALSAKGYFVLMPNPRGSYGQGEAFTRANVKDFGGGDLRDILAGVEEVAKRYPVDRDRAGITGWSYGGYMTMWAVTQTNRFRAAMAGAGVANWQSYYGQNLIDRWMIPFFGASVYDDPAVYEKSSPIRFIKNVKTPTLILVGERDAECPAPQSYEFWHALKVLGVPTELVVYAGEGHMFTQQKHREDLQDRTIAWFGKYLQRP